MSFRTSLRAMPLRHLVGSHKTSWVHFQTGQGSLIALSSLDATSLQDSGWSHSTDPSSMHLASPADDSHPWEAFQPVHAANQSGMDLGSAWFMQAITHLLHWKSVHAGSKIVCGMTRLIRPALQRIRDICWQSRTHAAGVWWLTASQALQWSD